MTHILKFWYDIFMNLMTMSVHSVGFWQEDGWKIQKKTPWCWEFAPFLFAFFPLLHLFSKRERCLNDVFWRHYYVLYRFWSLQRQYTWCWEFVMISWFNSDYWMKNILHMISFSTHMKKWLSDSTDMQLSQRDWIYLWQLCWVKTDLEVNSTFGFQYLPSKFWFCK